MGVETEGQNARASQASLQFFDVQTNKWTTSEEPLSDAFFAELRDIAGMDSNDSKIESDTFVESVLDVSRSEKEDRDMTGDKGFGGPDMDIDSVMEDPVAVPARDHQEEFGNLDELCADIMHMHGDKTISAVQAGHNMDIGYEFSWTGM